MRKNGIIIKIKNAYMLKAILIYIKQDIKYFFRNKQNSFVHSITVPLSNSVLIYRPLLHKIGTMYLINKYREVTVNAYFIENDTLGA